MAGQVNNQKTKGPYTSNLVTTTQSNNSYYLGGSINIEYDKNNCTPDGCHITMGNTITKNTMGGIFLLIGILCSFITLGAFSYRNSKNLQGVVVMSGTFGAGNSVMGKLADGILGFLKK